MYLVYVRNLPDVIWLTFKQKQGVWILFVAMSIVAVVSYSLKHPSQHYSLQIVVITSHKKTSKSNFAQTCDLRPFDFHVWFGKMLRSSFASVSEIRPYKEGTTLHSIGLTMGDYLLAIMSESCSTIDHTQEHCCLL
jgi:hypothetical protein